MPLLSGEARAEAWLSRNDIVWDSGSEEVMAPNPGLGQERVKKGSRERQVPWEQRGPHAGPRASRRGASATSRAPASQLRPAPRP